MSTAGAERRAATTPRPGLIGCALLASETAANIARRCRSNPRLLSMLVQEKADGEANRGRFAHDFKTLADVLVQHVVAERICRQFPELNGNVFGEENDTIRNNKGQDVTIKVGNTVEETLQCLSEALDDDLESAKSLAEAAHKEFTLEDLNVDSYPTGKDVNLDLKKIGIWIDPIDSTNEYINGNVDGLNEYGFHSSGLHCVTINIGLFDRCSGKPIAGVINQPFFQCDSVERWSGRCFWANCDGQESSHSLPEFISCDQCEACELSGVHIWGERFLDTTGAKWTTTGSGPANGSLQCGRTEHNVIEHLPADWVDMLHELQLDYPFPPFSVIQVGGYPPYMQDMKVRRLKVFPPKS
ncbi:inositol polyphosphate 1-phosphatase isoform X2 [Sipha flava]|uniref:inositol-1,4-bisphosphate 1-phosphatase n=1 Tax=Sipha flava TaxID=143950 RepID=A0A8B8FET7_9HEMI|nr:inositol polyphosphate 1-phosphatase isoform X2 [Sipha flava]